MYSFLEIFNIIFNCDTATDLLKCKSILDEIQDTPFLLQKAYDFKMKKLIQFNQI